MQYYYAPKWMAWFDFRFTRFSNHFRYNLIWLLSEIFIHWSKKNATAPTTTLDESIFSRGIVGKWLRDCVCVFYIVAAAAVVAEYCSTHNTVHIHLSVDVELHLSRQPIETEICRCVRGACSHQTKSHAFSHAFGSKPIEFIIGFVTLPVDILRVYVLMCMRFFSLCVSFLNAVYSLCYASSIYLFHAITTEPLEIFSLIGKWINGVEWNREPLTAMWKCDGLL